MGILFLGKEQERQSPIKQFKTPLFNRPPSPPVRPLSPPTKPTTKPSQT